jgi:hypothetical protein
VHWSPCAAWKVTAEPTVAEQGGFLVKRRAGGGGGGRRRSAVRTPPGSPAKDGDEGQKRAPKPGEAPEVRDASAQ